MSAILSLAACVAPPQGYPAEWWAPVPEAERASWEILPQEAAPGEVIVSKRTVLGVFSNFAPAPFEFDGENYASVEGFWQMMKYPDPQDTTDPRHELKGWRHSRLDVAAMSAWDAKHAGEEANVINPAAGVNWISYKGKRFFHKDGAEGSAFHLQLIEGATLSKIFQNPELAQLLISTGDLRLRMDHDISRDPWPAYQTPWILMKIRDHLCSPYRHLNLL